METDNDKSSQGKQKTGPKSQTVIIKEQWEDAVGKALQKKRPPEGWPKPKK